MISTAVRDIATSHAIQSGALPLKGEAPALFQGLLLFLAYPCAIRAAEAGIAGVAWIVDANLVIRACGTRDTAAGLGFRVCAFAWMIDGNTSGGRATRTAISLAIAATDRDELPCANGWFGLAGALRIGNFALIDTEITILPVRAGQPPYRAANCYFGLLRFVTAARQQVGCTKTG